jgi:hypothetical protein
LSSATSANSYEYVFGFLIGWLPASGEGRVS